MWEVRHCKKDVQAQLKAELAELEARRKEAIAENDDVADLEVRGWFRWLHAVPNLNWIAVSYCHTRSSSAS